MPFNIGDYASNAMDFFRPIFKKFTENYVAKNINEKNPEIIAFKDELKNEFRKYVTVDRKPVFPGKYWFKSILPSFLLPHAWKLSVKVKLDLSDNELTDLNSFNGGKVEETKALAYFDVLKEIENIKDYTSLNKFNEYIKNKIQNTSEKKNLYTRLQLCHSSANNYVAKLNEKILIHEQECADFKETVFKDLKEKLIGEFRSEFQKEYCFEHDKEIRYYKNRVEHINSLSDSEKLGWDPYYLDTQYWTHSIKLLTKELENAKKKYPDWNDIYKRYQQSSHQQCLDYLEKHHLDLYQRIVGKIKICCNKQLNSKFFDYFDGNYVRRAGFKLFNFESLKQFLTEAGNLFRVAKTRLGLPAEIEAKIADYMANSQRRPSFFAENSVVIKNNDDENLIAEEVELYKAKSIK